MRQFTLTQSLVRITILRRAFYFPTPDLELFKRIMLHSPYLLISTYKNSVPFRRGQNFNSKFGKNNNLKPSILLPNAKLRTFKAEIMLHSPYLLIKTYKNSVPFRRGQGRPG